MISMAHGPTSVDIRVSDHDSPCLPSHFFRVGFHCRAVFALREYLVPRDIYGVATIAIEFLNPDRHVSGSLAHRFILKNEFGMDDLADRDEKPITLALKAY